MREAGCWHISYGIESGDADILESVNKNLDFGQIRNALQFTRKAGLRAKGFFMVGFPGETEATLAATSELALSLPLDDITVMQLTPFPGTKLYATAHKAGLFDDDWRKMNTLNTVFVPRGMTPARLERARRQLIRKFYLQPGIILRKLAHIIRNPRLMFHMLRGLATLLRV